MLVVNIANDPAGQWLANSVQFSVREAGGSGTGSDVVLAKLSEVLFIETLRRFIQDLPDHQKGWLAGARDPVIGEALALMHKNPGGDWTVESLARQVGASRTRFAERFRHFLGEPPMEYLARWRLNAGRGNTCVFPCERRRDCGRGRLYLGSGVQPHVQAGIRMSAGAVPP
jgi:AraC-like DNA-binding protein